MSKREAIAAINERLGSQPGGSPPTSVWRQLRCTFTCPFFRHAYDAIFVRRPDKMLTMYEHCVCCGRARSWVALHGSNYRRPGSVDYYTGKRCEH